MSTEQLPLPSLLINDIVSEWKKDKYQGYVKARDWLKKCQSMLKNGLLDGGLVNTLTESWDLLSFNFNFFQNLQDKDNTLSGKKILILAYGVTEWDPSSVITGITGSEEAIIYCSEILTEKGYLVDILAKPPSKSIWRLPISNPRYYDSDSQLLNKYDIVILWRRTDFSYGKIFGNKVYFWPHDISTHTFNIKDCDGCFWLSDFQRLNYISKTPLLTSIPYVISGNGIDVRHFWFPVGPGSYPSDISNTDPVTDTNSELIPGLLRNRLRNNLNMTSPNKKNKYSCIYASNYARGLMDLLNIWPEIHKEFPEATLSIYYGRPSWTGWNETTWGYFDKKLGELKNMGVKEWGIVGHLELAQKFMETSIWAYPCCVEETYCITAVKAQMAGCIPVTTDLAALKEMVLDYSHVSGSLTDTDNGDIGNGDTTNNYSSSSEVNKSLTNIIPHNLRNKEYCNTLINVMRNIDKYDRSVFVKFAESKTWNKVVEKWEELF